MDNIEMLLGRLDERTKEIQKDISEIKADVRETCTQSMTNKQDIALLRAEDRGFTKRQTKAIGGAITILNASLIALIEYLRGR